MAHFLVVERDDEYYKGYNNDDNGKNSIEKLKPENKVAYVHENSIRDGVR